MTKTTLDVATQALRVVGVTAVDETPDASDFAFAKATLQGIRDELVTGHGATISWTLDADDIPDALFLPLAELLATDLAIAYARPMNMPRSRALTRVRTILFPDDREDRADTDDSGTVSTEEAEADLRAQYY